MSTESITPEIISREHEKRYRYESVIIDRGREKMATMEEHLIMSDWHSKIAEAKFRKALSSEHLEERAGYFAISAECLLVSTDHLLNWFTRSDAFTSRRGRTKAFANHAAIKRLDYAKSRKIMTFFDKLEYIRNRMLYLRSTSLDEVEFIGITELNLLLRRYSDVYGTIRRIR
jgi:hypothetical protein